MTPKEFNRLERDYFSADKRSKACAQRRSDAHGSSRAKITTLNAKWMIAAEHRDRLLGRYVDACAELGIPVKRPPEE